MNKNEQAQEKSKDVFVACQDMVDKAFNSVNQAVPRYHQSIANTQQEVFKTLESGIESAIELQKEFATKAGVPSTVPEAGLRAAKDATEGYVQMVGIGNQITLAAIDAVQQGVKTANENAKAFNDLNRNTMRSWIAAYAVAN